MKELIKKIKKARFIWICGNGGSAATADHFANDLIKKGYRGISLTSNSALITMIANDYGYENIFSYQLSLLANSKDLVICISCSGKSQNIINAQAAAFNVLECDYYTFPIFDGDLEQEHSLEEYGILENNHLTLAHAIANRL